MLESSFPGRCPATHLAEPRAQTKCVVYIMRAFGIELDLKAIDARLMAGGAVAKALQAGRFALSLCRCPHKATTSEAFSLAQIPTSVQFLVMRQWQSVTLALQASAVHMYVHVQAIEVHSPDTFFNCSYRKRTLL